uniref:Uncharacterized protein n=1 Tax=Plectus sambesii TaxID=2011161 RepID=A0A914X9H5_9BILA
MPLFGGMAKRAVVHGTAAKRRRSLSARAKPAPTVRADHALPSARHASSFSTNRRAAVVASCVCSLSRSIRADGSVGRRTARPIHLKDSAAARPTDENTIEKHAHGHRTTRARNYLRSLMKFWTVRAGADG